MSHTALVKFAPIYTLERFNDPKWRPDRRMYHPGALRFLPGTDTVPLIVDHDDPREIGVVHELFKMDWIDGPWICARATVNAPPSWLQRGRRASFGSKVLDSREVNIRGNCAEVVAHALVTEVSVLSPSVQPAEPCAEVLSFRPIEKPASSPAASSTSDRAAGEVIYGDGTLVRRYYENAVLAVGGRPVQTSSGQAIRRVGRDYIVDQPDGSQVSTPKIRAFRWSSAISPPVGSLSRD